MSTWRFQILGRLVFCLLSTLRPEADAATDPFLLLGLPVITNNQIQFPITGESGVSYVIESSNDLQSWSPIATNINTNISSIITVAAASTALDFRAWRFPLPVFADALVTRLNITLKGNDVHFDSWLKTGPTGVYALGPAGYAGPIGWTGPGLFGPEWYRNDFRLAFPNVAPPFTFGFFPTGFGTNYWVLSDADYFLDGDILLQGATNILVTGAARLYVTGQFQMHDPSRVILLNGASLSLYSGVGRTELTQVDNPGSALAFQYYGLPGVTNILWAGNSLKGTIYAPQAAIRFDVADRVIITSTGRVSYATLI